MIQMNFLIRTFIAATIFGAWSAFALGEEDYPMHRSLDPSLENKIDPNIAGMFNRDYYSRVPEIRN